MLLRDILEYVEDSELSTPSLIENLSSPDADIKKSALRKIVNYIHLGLLDLNTRFHFNTTVVPLKLFSNISIYQPRITSNIALLDVYDSDGCPLKFPEYADDGDWDIKQIDNGSFIVREPSDNVTLMFVYSTVPKKVTDLDTDIDIPEVALEALLFFVALKGVATFSPNMNEVAFNQSDMFKKRYLAKIHELKEAGFGYVRNREAITIDRGFR